ncbi:MAG: TSUP family transporter [Lachnospiraceae bacterium]
MIILFFIISFFSCIIGAICGIGGGVIMKPVLDAFHMAPVSVVSFLSGCSVLAMSVISFGKNLRAGREIIKKSTPLAVGAAIGGLLGKAGFQSAVMFFGDERIVGLGQSIIMFMLNIGAILYTVRKVHITTLQVSHKGLCLLIGLVLGMLSAFLGIGGGAINIMILCYFFSMGAKEAGLASLNIIMLSQLTSLGNTLILRNVPAFGVMQLFLMIAGGILGGSMGYSLKREISEKQVEQIFIATLVVIIIINIYNIYQFAIH